MREVLIQCERERGGITDAVRPIYDRLCALVERWRSPLPATLPESDAIRATARACADELAAILGMEQEKK